MSQAKPNPNPGASGKESACNAGDLRDVGWIRGLGRSHGREHGSPLQCTCLEARQGPRSLVGYNPWGHKESDTTEASEHTHPRATLTTSLFSTLLFSLALCPLQVGLPQLIPWLWILASDSLPREPALYTPTHTHTHIKYITTYFSDIKPLKVKRKEKRLNQVEIN